MKLFNKVSTENIFKRDKSLQSLRNKKSIFKNWAGSFLSLLCFRNLAWHTAQTRNQRIKKTGYHESWPLTNLADMLGESAILTEAKKLQSGCWRHQAILGEILSIIKLAQMPHPTITKNCYNSVTWTKGLCNSDCSYTIHSWRTPKKQTIILQKIPDAINVALIS